MGALSNLFQDQHLQRLHSQRVSLRPQPRHDGGRRHRDIGAVINWLAAMNVADVKFYNRPLEHLEGVQECDRGEHEGGRIDNDPLALVDCFMNPVDQLFFAIGLTKLYRPISRRLPAPGLDFGQCRRPVDFRLSLAKAVEVRPFRM